MNQSITTPSSLATQGKLRLPLISCSVHQCTGRAHSDSVRILLRKLKKKKRQNSGPPSSSPISKHRALHSLRKPLFLHPAKCAWALDKAFVRALAAEYLMSSIWLKGSRSLPSTTAAAQPASSPFLAHSQATSVSSTLRRRQVAQPAAMILSL